ncbi:zinc finger protein 366 [Entelurus aequoreus]|uniref:zinc finger protein 366 n=1 Tax=Entelurus aequoreus TaxID=161455 RepID=UPI002B1D1E0B|nr:zinc finger protein 366 [Entelurus aequoreus]XP_061880200.1 zinc finger protein 366 [Entelurus aequoreus]
METVHFSPSRTLCFPEDARQGDQRSFYLTPSPLIVKVPKCMSPTADHGSPPGPPDFFPNHKEGSQKRKRTPIKIDAQDSEQRNADEDEESTAPKTSNLSFPSQLMPASPLRPITGMIELNRFHHRAIRVPVQVKQEPLSPPSMWPVPPLLIHPSYFPPLHPSLFPYPFFMPGPVMPFPPGAFNAPEDVRPGHRSRDISPRGRPSGTEKISLDVHVDDSYYVDVGGDQKRWKCRMCEKSYTSKYNLVTHILGHKGIKPHGCHLCGKLFKQLSHLHTHLLTHQGMRPHKCQVCHKAFTQTSHLKRHMMQHSDVKPYSCSVCGRGFAYPSELRTHELKHEKGQDNVCIECGLDFPTLAQLKRHLTAHRGPTLYRCSECQKTFQYPSQLQNHMMKHKDIRPYICSECGMEFIQSHHLKQHTLTHKGVKEHKCDICGREFTLLANMKRHMLIHTNVRAYQCHKCFKSFVQKQTLKAHMIVHSDVKPYKCKLCGKEFNRMHNLMGHMHLHSDSKPFKCLYCPSKFTLKGNLTRHMKVKHGIMDRGLDERLFRQRVRFRLSSPMSLLGHFNQKKPFDLSQKPPSLPGHHFPQSDGESMPGSSCQEEDDESLYRRSQYSPEEAHGQDALGGLEVRVQGSPAQLRQEEQHQRESHGQGHLNATWRQAVSPYKVAHSESHDPSDDSDMEEDTHCHHQKLLKELLDREDTLKEDKEEE